MMKGSIRGSIAPAQRMAATLGQGFSIIGGFRGSRTTPSKDFKCSSFGLRRARTTGSGSISLIGFHRSSNV
jgi:hypothetical protein